ncbi:DUF4129 domain-containing protein [Fodinibacter luteus]|uniref:DUF4129 domain-containing protein n=1 Tax=Fodinibacter luteus TaxID=552064 RepID=A0ABP8JZI8_9MICO
MRLDPPLDPTSPEARDWLEEELRKGIYRDEPGLLERLWGWLTDVLSTTGGGSLPAWTVALAVGVALAVVALVVARSLGAERRMTGAAGDGVLDGPTRTSDEHRAAARRALAAGDADTAVLEGYRAIARAAVERTLLDDLPGRTAHEVALALGPAFPDSAARLAGAADAFDAVRYGHRAARAETAQGVCDLDATLASTRPVLSDPRRAAGTAR